MKHEPDQLYCVVNPSPACCSRSRWAAAGVAAVAGRDVVTALIGALLVVVYWVVERLAAASARAARSSWAMVVGVVGMVVRLTSSSAAS